MTTIGLRNTFPVQENLSQVALSGTPAICNSSWLAAHHWATTGTVQVGNTTTPTSAGTFDLAPIFNLGTGGEVVSYLRTTLTRSTGPEVTPTRTLTALNYDDNNVTHALTIAGGDVTVNGGAGTGDGAITLTNGHVVTGSNTLYFNPNAPATATVVRTNGYVDGNFKKAFAAAASKTFEIGTGNGFSPVTVTPPAGAGTFPADFTVKATQGPQPSVNPATSVQRYWTLTNGGLISADLTFAYLATDVQGTEANYKVIHISAGTPVAFPTSTVNTGAHIAILTGATAFSDWTVSEITSHTSRYLSIPLTIRRFPNNLPSITVDERIRVQRFPDPFIGFYLFSSDQRLTGVLAVVPPGIY